MEIKTILIPKKGRAIYSQSVGTASSSSSSSSSTGGGGGSGLPYHIDANGNYVIDNGYSADDSGNTLQLGANLILKGNFICEGEVAAYTSGLTSSPSGGTGGDVSSNFSPASSGGTYLAAYRSTDGKTIGQAAAVGDQYKPTYVNSNGELTICQFGVRKLTQTEYDNLGSYDSNTLYVIVN